MKKKLTLVALIISIIFIGVGVFLYTMPNKGDSAKGVQTQADRSQQLEQQQQQPTQQPAQQQVQQPVQQPIVQQQPVVQQPVQQPVQQQQPVVQQQPVQQEPVVHQEEQPLQDYAVRMSELQREELGTFKGVKDVEGVLIDKIELISVSSTSGTQLFNINYLMTLQTTAGNFMQFYITGDSYEKIALQSSLNVQYKYYEYKGNNIYDVLSVKMK